MKKILLIMMTLACLGSAYAGQQFDASTWRKVPVFNVSNLAKQETSLIGRVVGVRFHYRSPKLRHLQPNWYEAALWQHDPKAKNGYSFVRVVIAKKDVPAFKEITSDFNSMSETTVYGRVETDPENNLPHLRLIGGKASLDASGNATVDW